MPKRFDCEDEPNEFMDMPCRCDCGKFFDLLDGHNSAKNNKVICAECKEDEESFHHGDDVIFTEACYINDRLRAYEYNKGVITSRFTVKEGHVSVKVEGRKHVVHNVPTGILEKLPFQ